MKRIFFIGFLFLSLVSFSQKTNYKSAIVAFYNFENFYDTIDNPMINDNEFTPKGEKNYNSTIYWSKVQHLATVISQIGTDMNADGPAILGVAEIENDTVLNDLIKNPLISQRHYAIVHYDSRDIRGVDVAFLYNPKYFTVLQSDKLFVSLPAGAKESIFTRDVLWVKGILNGDTVHVFVNHWPSRLGGEERSAPGRAAAASVSKHIVDSLNIAAPNEKVIIMGDLNDDPISPSLTKVLGAKGKIENVQKGDLFNPWVEMYKKGYGTLAYQDAWGLFDQIVINYPWLDKSQSGYFYYQQHIFNKQYLIENYGKYKGYPMRTWDGNTYRAGYSDHFPTYLVMLKKVN